MVKPDLTSKQKQVLEFIIKMKSKMGSSPTVREIRDHFGFKAVGTVQDHLAILQRKGYIRRSEKARDVQVLDNAGIEVGTKDTVRLPVVGQVAAGTPILAQENLEGYLHVDRSLARAKDAFLLRVQGRSMIKVGIMDGDWVIVSPQKNCENGEIAVCLLEDDATIKRFYRKQDHIVLKAENDSFKPIVVKLKEKFSVLGKVTGVIRRSV